MLLPNVREGVFMFLTTHIFNFEKLKELKLLTGKTVLFFLLKTSINFRLLLLITRKVKSLHPLAK